MSKLLELSQRIVKCVENESLEIALLDANELVDGLKAALMEKFNAGEKGKHYEKVTRVTKSFADPVQAELELLDKYGEDIYDKKLKNIKDLGDMAKGIELAEKSTEFIKKINHKWNNKQRKKKC